MILDSIHNAQQYATLHQRFAEVFAYLLKTDFSALPDGKITLDGDAIYINLATNEGKKNAPLEAHRDYIDIQMPLSATETMGWKPTADCKQIEQPYDKGKDIAFYADGYDTKLTVKPGQFVIFFPDDAHAPAMAPGALRKLVVKIRK